MRAYKLRYVSENLYICKNSGSFRIKMDLYVVAVNVFIAFIEQIDAEKHYTCNGLTIRTIQTDFKTDSLKNNAILKIILRSLRAVYHGKSW